MTPNEVSPPDFALLAIVFAAGVGTLLGATANLLLGRYRPAVRVAVAGAALASCGVVVWFVTESQQAGWMAVGVASAAILFVAYGPGVIAAIASRPRAQWGGLAAAGLSVAVGSVAWFEYESNAAAERASMDMALVGERPPTRLAAARLVTDRGATVPVMEATDPRAQREMAALEERFLVTSSTRNRVIRRQQADDRSNCHGWVFTGGRFWVGGVDVETILADNGYTVVTNPNPGDLAIYRTDGAVVHTAVVRYVTPGMPVLVEGKWGATGVYLHDVDASTYGVGYTYYRAQRATHILAGLDSVPVLAGGQ